MLPNLLLVLSLGFGFAVKAAEIDDVLYFDAATPTPGAVLALQNCDADERTPAYRRAFAGGFIFAVKCASNNENFVETLIFAESENGRGGWLLEFPLPAKHGGGVHDMLANIRWYPDKNETGEIFVDRKREDKSFCRSEGRWRLEGENRTPKLIFWRETEDCDGRMGWVALIGER